MPRVRMLPSVIARWRDLLIGTIAGTIVFAATSIGGPVAWGETPANWIQIKQLDDKIRVELDGKLFTEYVYTGTPRPILYPVIGPHEIAMTRNYPMVKDVEGETHDHVHHRSLWFTHGAVNGVDFWAEGRGSGKIVQDEIVRATSDKSIGVIETKNSWVRPDGTTVCTDTRKHTFGITMTAHTATGRTSMARTIDFEVTIHASHGDLKLGDTKEGTMAIRTHPLLRLAASKDHGGTDQANGQMTNSEGVRGKGVLGNPAWGQRAKWLDYWGDVDGHVVGIAIFDHPKNPRHPTTWMARGYGLVGANPFGLHEYLGEAPGCVEMLILAGESVSFRYRFLFHEGDFEQAKIAE
jgi:hypothetical protein